MFRTMSIKKKLLGVVLGIVILGVLNIGMTLNVLRLQDEDALLLNVAGRQRMLSQKMSKSISIILSENVMTGQELEQEVKELKKSQVLFDETISAFMNGGILTNTTGDKVKIDALIDMRATVENVNELWTGFSRAIDQVLSTSEVDAVHYIYTNNTDLLAKSNTLVTELQILAEKKISLLKRIQYMVSALLIIMFVFVYFMINKSIVKPLEYLVRLMNSASLGDYSNHSEITSLDEVGKLSKSYNAMLDSVYAQSNIANRIAIGEDNIQVNVRSDNDVLNLALREAIQNMDELIVEVNHLISSAKGGVLDKRADDTKFNGRWRELVIGMNELVDATAKPIIAASSYIDELSEGKNIENIENVYNGEFKKLFTNISKIKGSIDTLSNETEVLINAAKLGDLKTRGNSDLVNGRYSSIIEGFNQALETIIRPLNEAITVMGYVSKGNFSERMTGEYNGDYNMLKNAINETIASTSDAFEDIEITLESFANKELNVEIVKEYNGDWNKIKVSLNRMLDIFNEIFDSIKVSASEIGVASESLKESNVELSDSVVLQSKSLLTMKSNADEFVSKISDNDESVTKVSRFSNTTVQKAQEGVGLMNELLGSIGEIVQSSNEIAKIIEMIDSISFQTNILALNAAVEAARAGESGKGFAVVAEEVRNLAARSANAAKQTSELVDKSISLSNEGQEKANRTSKTLADIIQNISEIANMMNSIADNSQYQTSLATEISQEINVVSSSTRVSASTAEKSAAASEELNGQFNEFNDVISKFKLRGYDEMNNQRILVSID